MLQDVIHPPQLPEVPPQPPQAEQLSTEEISSPISAPIFELCGDPDLFPETLQNNSEVTSTSNCCFEEISSYAATNISPALDLDNKINSNSTIVTTSTSTTTTTTTGATSIATATTNNARNSGNPSVIFDSQKEIDNDISASIDFSSSPAFFAAPPLLPITTTQQEQFDLCSAAAGSVLKGLSQYPTDPVVAAPPMGAPLQSVFEGGCISSISSFVPINSASASCSYLSPTGMGAYMPPPGPLNTTALSAADSSALFGGNILLGSELQAQELDYQGENGGIYCTDSIERVFNTPELQALGAESRQQLVAGAGSSATLAAPEMSNLGDPTLKVGKLSVEQRKEKIHRYMKKRNERNFSKKIKYACRKTLADSRPRVRGRFAKNDDFGENHRQACGNHEEDDEEEIAVKEDDDLVDSSSDIFAHISGVNSFKCNYSIQSWI